MSKKYVLIELLSCLEVDFNYHEPIVQKSMADTRGRDACKPDRLVLTATGLYGSTDWHSRTIDVSFV